MAKLMIGPREQDATLDMATISKELEELREECEAMSQLMAQAAVVLDCNKLTFELLLRGQMVTQDTALMLVLACHEMIEKLTDG